MEAVHDGLPSEHWVEEELFANNNIADILEKLVVGEFCFMRAFYRCLRPFLFPVHLLVVHGFGNLQSQQVALAIYRPILNNDHNGKDNGQ